MRRPSRKDSSLRPRDPLFNSSAHKALMMLETFGGERRTLGLAELASAAGMSISSAQRCIHTLVRIGYLRRDERLRRWVLTPRALALTEAYLSGHALLEHATAHLIELNQASGESVSLSEPDGTDMVFIARFPSLQPFHIHMPVGRRLPMYCTASGRAYLSALPPASARRILARARLTAHTPQTLTDLGEICRRIDAAREAGYAWSDQEYYRGDVTIAAPVLGDDGLPLAAVNISAPTSRWTLAQLRVKLAPLLLQSAQAASLGHTLRPPRRVAR
ncbi:MAG TPA: IclR family transcriptional regulator [Steroidobacteraceae bacterium]|nr:IclR family transcriptional regulator [Steroidobacteraceae bacterium]